MRLAVISATVGTVLISPLSADNAGENDMNKMDSTFHGNEQPWTNSDPLQFMRVLKNDPKKVVQVFGQAPSGWINQKHAKILLGLLGSNESASPVLEIKCPSMPKAPSTLGKLAAFLLLGYVEDRFPPSGNSDLQYYSDDQIRHLASERQRSQPMNAEVAAFSVARQELRRGESLQTKREYKGAIDAYLSGITKLGDRYASPDLIDNARMKQTPGESEQAKGNLETAANLLHNVLESRIHAYQTHHSVVPE